MVAIRDGGPILSELAELFPVHGSAGDPSPMSISVFSRRSRLSVKALRLYERIGVLVPARVDPGNGYRFYTEDQLVTARLIVLLRKLDMPLAYVAEVVASDREHAAALVAAYWEQVETRLAGQRELASYLHHKLSPEEDTVAMFNIRERELPDQVVISETHHVTIGDLPELLAGVSGRLIDQAMGAGGLAGHLFVIYHGVLDEDNGGPVEICVPVHPDRENSSGAASTRLEPAHREAYVVLRKAQFAHPQILAAYDAVAEWSMDNTGGIAGHPREVYYPGFPFAGPDEKVSEIAYPVHGKAPGA